MSPRGGRLTSGGENEARLHWKKSAQFALAARRELESALAVPAYSNAIFAVMHAADALCLHYLGHRSSGHDHHDAVGLFDTISEIPSGVKAMFVRHLEDLVDVKSLVQYSGDNFSLDDAGKALKHMDRALGAIQGLVATFGWR